MPILSTYAQKRKRAYFLDPIPKDAHILEIGCGNGWVRDYLRAHNWTHYVGMDLSPPADIVGSILEWRRLGLKPASFDYIIAFEVVEHVDCFQACYDLLRPHGKLLLTSPLPQMDWFLRILEAIGFNQRRTSPHNQLIDFRRVPHFSSKRIQIVGGLAQWGIFTR